MRIMFQVLAVLAAQASFGQSRPVPTGPDLDDLYARVSESAYVVKGRVLDYKGVGKRFSLAPQETGWTPTGRTVNIEEEKGGILFTVATGETVCRQSDFAVAPSESPSSPGLVHIFVPRGEPSVQSRFDSHRRVFSEYLRVGKDYLLFLRRDPRQAELASTYQLDPGLTYYRTYEGDRGAVQLPDAANPEGPYAFITPLVSAVTTFCDAVKARDVETKIRQLDAVKSHSTDPAWRQSVDAAINALQQAQTNAPQK